MTDNKTEGADSVTTTTLTTFKGFDAQLRCRGFQYKIGATYTHTGTVQACESGFHACENPLDVLDYYPLLDGDGKPNRFAVVEQSGTIARHESDSKIASASITIKTELSIPEFVTRAVKWVIAQCSEKPGDSAKLAASWDSAKLAASGDYAQLAASGDSAKLAASGDYAQLAASGDYAKLAASGDYAQLAASGDCAQLAASGKDSVIASSAPASRAQGADGTWIALAEFDKAGKCVGFATGCIGRDGLKPDTWYGARGGKLVEPR